jgi:outer membrane protein
MKQRILISLCSLFFSGTIYAANLIEVYQQAIVSDPTYQQSIAKNFATGEGVYISLANLLPSINGTYQPYLSQQYTSGPGAVFLGDKSTRGYNVVLTATQTIFNFAQISNFAQARATAKQSGANLNFAAQDLMARVVKAYFQVLEDVDNLRSSESTKAAYAKQLDQVNQQYKVGIKTITDVYTAQASYEASSAEYITAMTTLENDRENLRVITGKMYPSLARLNDKFPLLTPKPADMDDWVAVAIKQNWQIKAAQYGVTAAKQNIRQQFSGHLPTLNAQGTYTINFSRDMGTTVTDLINPPGAANVATPQIALNLNVPIIQGGLVLAQTRQAKDNYQIACQQLEQQIRATTNITRQSYLNVIAGIQKIQADQKAIQSSKSSLAGMEAGYRVGTEILVNVLNQQQQVFINQRIYAHDRYAYIYNIIALKQAAGTLSPGDLAGLNAWLGAPIPLDKQFPAKVRKAIEGAH